MAKNDVNISCQIGQEIISKQVKMLITKVEIENIKNYESVTYDFEPGITAISGPNGAGKTTIIESIAYALFDYLPYKKEDFLKRGATKGAVRITFVSVVDGREYTVYRDTQTGYFVFDPITKGRLVEQKSQVTNWIREHLGIDSRTDLRALFTSTIGVPQGTFTLEFADQPAKRKIGFDRVLRVEDYQKASEAVRPLVKLLDNKETDLENEIARLTSEVAPLTDLLLEKKHLDTLHQNLKEELSQAEKELQFVRRELERLTELAIQIEILKNDTQSLKIKLEGLVKIRGNLLEGVQASERASDLITMASSGYQAYNHAVTLISELEPQLAERDFIRQQLAIAEKEAVKIEILIQSQKEKQVQIEKYKIELRELADLVKTQIQLEERLRELVEALTEISMVGSKIAPEELLLQKLRQEFKELTQTIEEGESLKEIAESLPLLENQKQSIETELKIVQVIYEKLILGKAQLKQDNENLEKIKGEIKTLETEILSGESYEKVAHRLPEFEDAEKHLIAEIATMKVTVRKEEQLIAEIKEGKCPLLSQRCLNMKDGERLDTYFKLQVNNEKKRMRELELQKKKINGQIAEAKNALKTSSLLDIQRVQLERYRQDFSIIQNRIRNQLNELNRLSEVEAEIRALIKQLEKLNIDLKAAQQAQVKYQSSGVLRAQLERVSEEGVQKKEYLRHLKEIASQKVEKLNEKNEIEKLILNLNDPKGRTRLIHQELNNEPEVEDTLKLLEAKEQDIEQHINKISTNLLKFSNLDSQVISAREQRALNMKDYQVVIENQAIALLLEERKTELGKIDSELIEKETELLQKNITLNNLLENYDEAKHHSLNETLEYWLKRIATLTSESTATINKIEEVAIQVEILLAIKNRIETLTVEKAENENLLNISEFIREILRNSGPYITEVHLKSISIEANQLYRDITGNPLVSLKWDSGYEIIVEEASFERAFSSLSGGEQMSAALAVRLALLKELSDIRIAFFDEPTTNMDEERRRNLAEQIRRIKDLNQLFVISHDDTFEGFTDQFIELGR